MKTLPTFLSLLHVRLGQAVRSLQASTRTCVPRPTPVLVPISIRVDRGPHEAIQRRRRQGF